MATAATVKILPFLTAATIQSSLRCQPTARRASTFPPSADLRATAVASSPRLGRTRRTQAPQAVLPPRAAATYSAATAAEGMCDPELRLVLELATDEELLEFEEILYGTSYFSPVIKSIAKRPNSVSVVALDDIEERDVFISKLESRFLYLAADARSIIRGWRPSYRNVLLEVRRKLCVQCSSKLCTADLEAEIFLHLLDEYASRQKGSFSFPWDKQKSPKENPNIKVNNWKVLTDAAWRIGSKGLESTFLKGGSALTVKTIYESLAKRLSGKLLMETANYEIKKELLKQGGRLAAVNLESRIGLLAAKQVWDYSSNNLSRYVGAEWLGRKEEQTSFGGKQKGYKCWCPAEKRMFVSMDVVFKEHESFYGCETGGDKVQQDNGATMKDMIVGAIPVGGSHDHGNRGMLDTEQEQGESQRAPDEAVRWSRPNEEQQLQVYTRRHRAGKEQVQGEEINSEGHVTEAQERQALDNEQEAAVAPDAVPELAQQQISSPVSSINDMHSPIYDDLDLPISQRKPTRSTAGKLPSKLALYDVSNYVSYTSIGSQYKSFIAALDSAVPIPHDWQEAKQHPVWRTAMLEEMAALDKNNTWAMIRKRC